MTQNTTWNLLSRAGQPQHFSNRVIALLAALALAIPATVSAQPRSPRSGIKTPAPQAGGAEPDARPEPPSFETGIEFKPTAPRRKVTFNLEEASLQDLVRLISSITGKRFIIPGKIRSIKATVYAPKKVTAAEAYRAFLSILELNGLALVKSGRYLKVVESGNIESRTIGLYIDGQAPSDDRFVTQLHQLRNVTADDVSQLLSRFKSKEGSLTAYAPTNTLIITDTGSNIRRMMRLIEAIDLERPGEQLWIEPVHHANASELASRLLEIFPVDQPSRSSKRSKTKSKSSKRKKGSSGGSETATVGTRTRGFRISNIMADERTNSLIIMATEPAYLRILELVQHLDVSLDGEGGIHVHYLQHGDAKDIAKTLQSLISGSKKAGRAKSKKAATSSAGPFEGQIAVTAHESTNSLVITSSLHDYAALRRVIDRLDSERRQVFIEAVIMDMTVNRSRSLGISLHGGVPELPLDDSAVFFGMEASGSIAGALNPELLSGLAVGVQGPVSPELQQIGIDFPSFGVALKALSTSGDVDILSTPHLIAMDNEQAEINIGENVPLQGSSLGGLGNLASLAGGAGGGNAGAALSALGGLGGGSVPRRDVGTRIRITPHINDSDEIRLEIDQEISKQGTPVVGNANAISIERRTAKTQVVVRDQQTVVIGGLMSDKMNTAESKVPLLGDIPVIGALFRSTQQTKTKTNLLLFLTPYIVRSQSDLRTIYQRKLRERQEFADRYFLFGEHQYRAPVDHSRTRGLLAEIMAEVTAIQAQETLDAAVADRPPPGHEPRPPVGGFSNREITEEGDIVIIDGETSIIDSEPEPSPAAEPAAAPPPSSTDDSAAEE